MFIKSKMDKKYIIISILAILFILILILIPAGMQTIAKSRCNTECNKFDSLAFDIVYSGNWEIDDLCVCYLKDNKIKSFKLGE